MEAHALHSTAFGTVSLQVSLEGTVSFVYEVPLGHLAGPSPRKSLRPALKPNSGPELANSVQNGSPGGEG